MRINLLRHPAALAAVAATFVSAGFTQVAPPEVVESAPLARDAFSTGTLTQAGGALPSTLWLNAKPSTLEFLLDNLPARPATPALGEAMRRTLLSPGSAPDGAGEALGGKKLLALAQAGFVDEAAEIASLSTIGRGDPLTGRAEAVRDLLAGDIQSACRRGERLTSGRDNPFWIKLRVVCYAAAGEPDAADLSLGVLRDQFGLTPDEDVFLTAAATGVAPSAPPAASSPLNYAVARSLELPISPDLLSQAGGGVLIAVARDAALDAATRIDAGARAVAMGVMRPAQFSALVESFEFDVAALGGAANTAREQSDDPLTDAILYHSVKAMSAPEFLRDKAQRIALALSLGDTFYRSYTLSILYADEIAALEGSIVAPQEAAQFAEARMAVGDSVGAGSWLAAMIGPGGSIGALPEEQAIVFVESVNLLSLLDPQTAAQIARAGGISLLSGVDASLTATPQQQDPAVAAHILEAAFDAALEEKIGQAGLAALAASSAGYGPGEAVIVGQSLKAAGMADLERRYSFERAWAARFIADTEVEEAGAPDEAAEEPQGLKPRVKPSPSN